MRFVRYQASDSVHWGVLREETVHSLASLPDDEPRWEQFTDARYLDLIEDRLEYGRFQTHSREEVMLRPPVDRPSKIVSVGLNYSDHIKEQDADVPDRPLLFSKAPSAIVGPGDAIALPDDVEQVDYEVELAAVVGRTARNVPADEARNYVAGYTIINDVSARDAQFDDGQFFRGKSYDTFAPLGPALVTDGFDPNDASLRLTLNGDQRQRSNTREFIFDVPELFEYITNAMTLEPGDVIATGTPGGVGIFSDPPELLQPGDTVECTVDGIGTLENTVEQL
jgi:2-keto-4-pentenoate hydratase/2-oxohepta-3-ene-1,7-dioic acid hydratase in catechol pathway